MPCIRALSPCREPFQSRALLPLLPCPALHLTSAPCPSSDQFPEPRGCLRPFVPWPCCVVESTPAHCRCRLRRLSPLPLPPSFGLPHLCACAVHCRSQPCPALHRVLFCPCHVTRPQTWSVPAVVIATAQG